MAENQAPTPCPSEILRHTIPAWQYVSAAKKWDGQDSLLRVALEYNGYPERPTQLHKSMNSLRLFYHTEVRVRSRVKVELRTQEPMCRSCVSLD